jgi:hypothetical protein
MATEETERKEKYLGLWDFVGFGVKRDALWSRFTLQGLSTP